MYIYIDHGMFTHVRTHPVPLCLLEAVCVCVMVLIRHTLFFIPGATAKAVSTGMMAPLSCNSLIGKLARYPGGFHALGPLGARKSTINGDSAAGEAATKGWPFSIAAFDYSTAGEDLFPRVA